MLISSIHLQGIDPMKHSFIVLSRIAIVALLVLLLTACSSTPYKHESLSNFQVEQRALIQEQGAFRVRASVPSREEAEKIFGIPIYKRGIQPIWLEVTNNSPGRARFVLSSVDHNYFSPFEVAYMHKKHFSKQGWMDMEEYLYSTAMPRQIAAGETVSGFVYTHETNGTKNFNVDLFHESSKEDGYEEFTFFVQVPGFVPDHATVNFEALYEASAIRDLDSDGLRDALLESPCCTTNRDGSGQGPPVNLVLVAKGREVLQSLLRAGWTETSYEKDDNYLKNVNYLYGRPPDAVFRKSRGKANDRNELSLWLAPMRTDGIEVWMAQIKHAIGQRYKINEIFFGSAQDPDVDDGRNFLLQNLWYSQSLKALAYTHTGKVVAMENPQLDFNNNPFFSDGIRIVMWLSGEPVALQETRNLQWNEPVGAR
jgi:hypothetical protein